MCCFPLISCQQKDGNLQIIRFLKEKTKTLKEVFQLFIFIWFLEIIRLTNGKQKCLS